MMLVGVPPDDAAIIVDFFNRLDQAMLELAHKDDWPIEAFKTQEVVPGLIRVSTALRDVAEDEYLPHPRYLLSGRSEHIKWAALLAQMYPGGSGEPLLVYENVQGHPDWVCSGPGGLIIEIKTVGGGRWKQVQRAPLSRHVEQVKAYLFMGFRWTGLLVYENRDSLDVWCHVVRLPEAGVASRAFIPREG
jgi:hypothetical protein